ncbi:hypothetical protein [Brevundimonas sp.]|uniref:hypothetical protein n=1 Tax=Brevundimonas sp. TaxID=1871086 RepID=UPI001E014E21|nr:hypothetical protein [Brevundimonas sp.]MBL0948741.1 hypothetical protein [Brevundimonas sp.]
MTDAAQKAEAEKAMKLKAEAAPPAHPDPGRTAGEGMHPGEGSGTPMGALDAEGHRPVLERSRKVR